MTVSDLVKRLRWLEGGHVYLRPDDVELFNEAADEIERLRNTICMSLEQSKVGNWTVVRMYLNDALKDDKND
jgi:hypothetical protein